VSNHRQRHRTFPGRGSDVRASHRKTVHRRIAERRHIVIGDGIFGQHEANGVEQRQVDWWQRTERAENQLQRRVDIEHPLDALPRPFPQRCRRFRHASPPPG
jgi:hypothetical protein